MDMLETLCVLVSKLPCDFRDRWNKKAQGIKRNYSRVPCLSDFSGFVNEGAILVNEPIFPKEAVHKYVTHPYAKLKKHKKIRYFATHSTKEVFMICPLCDSKRSLDECKSSEEKSLQERSRFLFEQKLCYGCFSPIPSCHNTRNRKKRKEWIVWKKRHFLLCMVIRLKNSKKYLKRDLRKMIMSKRTFTVQQWTWVGR